MGIDIYTYWKNQTEEDRKAQYAGFATDAGHTGYLREAYHGGPYMTQVLLEEAFEHEGMVPVEGTEDSEGVPIPATVLRERLPRAIETIKERYYKVYEERLTDESPEVISLIQFVELAERKEAELGAPCYFYASY